MKAAKVKGQAAGKTLLQLARRMGIEPQYTNAAGKRVVISPDVIKSVLATMNCEVGGESQAEAKLKEIEVSDSLRHLPPVMVVREDKQPIRIPLNANHSDTKLHWRVVLEDKTIALQGTIRKSGLRNASAEDGARKKTAMRLKLPQRLPLGYHRCEVEDSVMQLIVTPPSCWLPPALENGERIWGLAVQLYLLKSAHNWGIGDFSDLAALIDLAAKSGASLIGLNPLHAMFLDAPEHASPYSPASRLYLNVLNIDVAAIPEFASCAEAQALLSAADSSQELEKVRETEAVDYRSVKKLKWDALRAVFAHFERDARPERKDEFAKFVSDGGSQLTRFCVFQAIRMKFAGEDPSLSDWRAWPAEFRHPDSEGVERFATEHAGEIEFLLWTQWIADVQLAKAAERADSEKMAVGLYRDLAVGSDARGAESWMQQDTVIENAHVGVPPDLWNPAGQDWGLPPFDPRKLRERGYRDYIELIRANMRHAGALRIDHVLGLQHLYWIPRGNKPSQGAYVTYPFDDLAGILALESWRNQCLVVGEDLGTVPAGFRERLAEYRILSYRVLYFEREENGGPFILPERYPQLSIATVGSHDLPTLRGWWTSDDIELRKRHNLYPEPSIAESHEKQRAAEKALLLEALCKEGFEPGDGREHESLCLAVHGYLARCKAAIAMLQVENLTGEISQVNLPATSFERPNWRRRLSIPIEHLATDQKIQATFELMRRERPKPVQ
ncbi:MAG: 4-alpha-glucanotransferase [Candidatus Acidiferrales bacterium]